jgi:tetratricopeptide (TPR) repeat protein
MTQALEAFLENIKTFNQRDNEGHGQLLLASCYEMSNKLNHAITYLEMFISQANLDPMQSEVESKACNQLGELYNKIGKYNLAAQYFERQFAILKGQCNLTRKGSTSMLLKQESHLLLTSPTSFAETPDLIAAKVQLGIAKANDQMSFFFETIADPNGVEALLRWKSKNNFGDYIPPTRRVMA